LDPAFIFVICVDAKFPEVRESLQSEYIDTDSVFFLFPPVWAVWGSISQTFAPWMTVKALRSANVMYDWISFHSGTDLVVRSREIIRTFLRTYSGHAEFFQQWRSIPGRFDVFGVGGPGCAQETDLQSIEEQVKKHYNQTAWNRSAANFGNSANWATVSQGFAEKILDALLADFDLAIRISFGGNSDETLLQTLANKVGLGHLGSCGMLRHLKFQFSHPFLISEETVHEAREGFFLFARKMPDDETAPSLHQWAEELIMEEDRDELPGVLLPTPGDCYRENPLGEGRT
jgi:hypothetical protein